MDKFMKVNGKIIKKKDWEYLYGMTDNVMKDSIKIIKDMVKG